MMGVAVNPGTTVPERLRKQDWFVTDVPLATCQRLVGDLHYSGGGSNTGTFCHGLMRFDAPMLVRGIAWWLPPTKPAAVASWDGDWKGVLALSRLAIEPDVPANAASFLLSRSVKLIARDGRYRCLITYADEWQGHTGAIYKAANWEYMGLTKPEATFVDGEGRMVARKATKSRTRAEMVALGCREVGKFRRHKFRMILPAGRSATNQLRMEAA